jgi:type IV secretion system protein TrbI
MTEPAQPAAQAPLPAPEMPLETLELRTKEPAITRISRFMLIGAGCIGLLSLAGLVIVALKPPKFFTGPPSELFNAGQKPAPEALNRLPRGYEGLHPPQPAARPGNDISGPLTTANGEAISEREQVERDRLARLAAQAKESGLFFRLQLKAAPKHDYGAAARVAGGEAIAASPSTPSSELTALTALRRTGDGTGDDAGTDPAEQTRKLAFLKAAPEKESFNPHSLQKPLSPYQLMAGTIIAASLVSGLNSDLPGFVIAQVTEHVYDSVAGRYLLVPQGTRIAGKYDSVVAFGQERALVVWHRLIFPDGTSIVLDNLPATDTAGYAGLTDEVDQHTWKLLKGIALSTLLGVGTSVAFGQGSGDSDLVRALRESTGQTTNRAGQRLVERQLNVQPTLTVRPGWPLRVIVHKDLILRPYREPARFNR